MGKLVRVFVALCAGSAAVLVPLAPVGADTGAAEMEFVGRLNELRTANGLRPLAIRGELFDVAREWSRRMAAAGDIRHNPALASQAPADWARLGENVGTGDGVESVHAAFAASPMHHRNMVDAAFDAVGVGVVRAPDGALFVTVDFMTTKAAPARADASRARPACRRAPARPARCGGARRR